MNLVKCIKEIHYFSPELWKINHAAGDRLSSIRHKHIRTLEEREWHRIWRLDVQTRNDAKVEQVSQRWAITKMQRTHVYNAVKAGKSFREIATQSGLSLYTVQQRFSKEHRWRLFNWKNPIAHA